MQHEECYLDLWELHGATRGFQVSIFPIFVFFLDIVSQRTNLMNFQAFPNVELEVQWVYNLFLHLPKNIWHNKKSLVQFVLWYTNLIWHRMRLSNQALN
jgi:hypothetical protein